MRGETLEVVVSSVDQDKNSVRSVIRAHYELNWVKVKGETKLTDAPNYFITFSLLILLQH